MRSMMVFRRVWAVLFSTSMLEESSAIGLSREKGETCGGP
jgi:hypothetical protein